MTTPDLLRLTLAAIEATEQDARDACGRKSGGDQWTVAHEPPYRWGQDEKDAEVLVGGKAVIRCDYEYGGRLFADHIARHDPASVLRRCAADRALIAEITAWKHAESEDSWYSCSQAPAWDDPTPGSGCANDDRAGQPCDCGRDDRVNALLGHIATGYGVTSTEPSEHQEAT